MAQALDVEFGDAAVQSRIQRLGYRSQIPVPLGKDGDLRLFTTVFGANDKVRECLVRRATDKNRRRASRPVVRLLRPRSFHI